MIGMEVNEKFNEYSLINEFQQTCNWDESTESQRFKKYDDLRNILNLFANTIKRMS